MPNLYERILKRENLQKAIETTLKKDGSFITKSTVLTRDDFYNEDSFRQIKNRLRGHVKPSSDKIIFNPKAFKNRIYDKIAQQAIYQIIEPIVDINMSKHSYAYRKGINIKLPVAKIANVIKDSKWNYFFKFDLTKYLNQVPLDSFINAVRHLGVKDPKALKAIKTVMWATNYDGIGLIEKSVLTPLLINCFLTRIDVFMEKNLDMTNKFCFSRDFDKHKENYSEWLKSRNRKPKAYYFRYADAIIIVSHSKSEDLWINEMTKEFLFKNMNVPTKDVCFESSCDKCHFLGFFVFKNKTKNKVGIRISNPNKIIEKIKQCKFNGLNETWNFLRWYVNMLNYFDIVNDMTPILKTLENRLWKRSSRKTAWIKKIGSSKYQYTYSGKTVTIDVFQLRKNSKVSFKEYLINGSWLQQRELLKISDFHNTKWYQIYKYSLWTKQKGKDPITNEPLNINEMDIHHIKPKKQDGTDEIENLILINRSTHKMIHSKKETNFRKIIQYRKYLVQTT